MPVMRLQRPVRVAAFLWSESLADSLPVDSEESAALTA
jgi:hypothetical protein